MVATPKVPEPKLKIIWSKKHHPAKQIFPITNRQTGVNEPCIHGIIGCLPYESHCFNSIVYGNFETHRAKSICPQNHRDMSLRQFISSRLLLRSIGAVKQNVTLKWKEFAELFGLHEDVFENPQHIRLKKPITVILIGAGHRGNIYARYGVEYPNEMKIVSVAEPNATRRNRLKLLHGIPDDFCYDNWQQVFEQPKFADAVIIATPDNLHTQPCLAALEAGYNILLEKPIAPTEEECRLIDPCFQPNDAMH